MLNNRQPYYYQIQVSHVKLTQSYLADRLFIGKLQECVYDKIGHLDEYRNRAAHSVLWEDYREDTGTIKQCRSLNQCGSIIARRIVLSITISF